MQPSAVPAASGLRLSDAVGLALSNYPAVLAAALATRQSQTAVSLARTQYLPELSFYSQSNRATDNSTSGMFFSSPLPSISGTVPAKDYSGRGAWTSAAGLYFAWEVYDFGRRSASTQFFRQLSEQARQQERFTRLQVGSHAADAYLSLLAAGQQTEVARTDVERWVTVDAIVRALATHGLKPQADVSRSDAELAAARIRLSDAQRNVDTAEAELAEAIARPASRLQLDDRRLLSDAPPLSSAAPAAIGDHPQLLARHAAVNADRNREKELSVSALPRFFALAAAEERNSGVQTPGKFSPGFNGFWPTGEGNWALSGQIAFSFTRLASNRDEKQIARTQVLRDRRLYDQTAGQLQRAERQAVADLQSAQRVAAEAPIELGAAQTGERQARVRYRTGLASINELAEAEALLARAQSDAALSQLALWRGWLELNFAHGDLRPFLATVAAVEVRRQSSALNRRDEVSSQVESRAIPQGASPPDQPCLSGARGERCEDAGREEPRRGSATSQASERPRTTQRDAYRPAFQEGAH
jgi:outer membrane protein TolC